MAEGQPALIRAGLAVAAGVAAACVAAPLAAQERPVPYWASIAKSEALMRTGPDRSYPALWLYKRRDLPVRVVQIHGVWRRVQEQDGTSGWMLARLLSARRTVVVAGATRPIRDAASASGKLLWQAESGVIGRVDGCDGAWCRIEIGDKRGYIEQAGVWGTSAQEVVD